MYHTYGLSGVMMALCAGHTVYTLPRFDPRHFLSAIATHRISLLHLVPPLVQFLARDPEVLKHDISSVRKILSAASPLPATCSAELSARSDALLVQALGMTETFVTHCDSPPIKRGTVGHVISSTEGKIVDLDTGKALGRGQTGELHVRGPQTMKGYLHDPQATSDVILDGGWLRTGDLGHYDEEGYLTITDRLKEVIKYKGFQVAPSQLEALLKTHPHVADVVVLGMDDPEAGELPTAFIVPKAGATSSFSQTDVLNFLHSQVAPHKKLRGGIKVVDSIPKDPSGKVRRRELKQSFTTR
ncbi:uncharacterized protein LOC143300300 [Babylonia areolata]|uniref:uncharacterized protein LOC143300300 n=1 Tax=Babylonia areolata TaxID=304850 RepID=UPI003FD3E833